MSPDDPDKEQAMTTTRKPSYRKLETLKIRLYNATARLRLIGKDEKANNVREQWFWWRDGALGIR